MTPDVVGADLGSVELEVERGKVRELSRALRGEDDAVPPTFTVVAAHTTEIGRSPNELIIEAAGLDQRHVLLGEMSWRYARPIEVGDRLVGTVRYLGTEVKTASAGELRVARGEVLWRDTAGVDVVTVRVTLIEVPPGSSS